MPREVEAGMEVISGCINQTGILTIQTTKEFGESTAAKILDLVENASDKKGRMENSITRFARYCTPAVVFAALALAILPPLVTGQAFSTWIYRALTFLVISCHPISLSIQKAYGKKIDNSRITDVQEIAGHGVQAVIDGMTVLAGNTKLMEREHIPYTAPMPSAPWSMWPLTEDTQGVL